MRRTLCCSVTAAGAEIARRLPYEHRHGHLVETVRSAWAETDALVLVGALGIVVRAVAPLLGAKQDDPAVVGVDDGGRFAVALVGGHAGGANALAREVAALLGADPVVTTASDGADLPSLDDLPGFRASGDVAGVTRRWLDGTAPVVHVDEGLADWPLPCRLADARVPTRTQGTAAAAGLAGAASAPGAGRVSITDSNRDPEPREVLLRPASIVVGVGASTGADPHALWERVLASLVDASIDMASVTALATLDKKAGEPAIAALADRLGLIGGGSGSGSGSGVRTFSAADLAEVAAAGRVPNPSATVARAVATPSVAEAAAVLAAGPGGTLVSAKCVSRTRDSTVALARRNRPPGLLAVVGLGPGTPALRTPSAATAIRQADTVIGYGGYVDLVEDLLESRQTVIRSPIGAESDRCHDVLERAAHGQRVALVCSGDAGVYAMASLVLELADSHGGPAVEVVPGVTAALSGAAILGAPLGHDHAAISLSDLLTPWEVIVRRLEAAGAGDFVVSLYNPRSQRRTTQLERALAILASHRSASTPAAVLTDIGRPGTRIVRTTLADLNPEDVGMLSLVMVGATSTRWIGAYMVTPRGYPARP